MVYLSRTCLLHVNDVVLGAATLLNTFAVSEEGNGGESMKSFPLFESCERRLRMFVLVL